MVLQSNHQIHGTGWMEQVRSGEVNPHMEMVSGSVLTQGRSPKDNVRRERIKDRALLDISTEEERRYSGTMTMCMV